MFSKCFARWHKTYLAIDRIDLFDVLAGVAFDGRSAGNNLKSSLCGAHAYRIRELATSQLSYTQFHALVPGPRCPESRRETEARKPKLRWVIALNVT